MQRKSITRPIYSTFTSTPRQKSRPQSSQLTETDDEVASTTSSNSLMPTSNLKRKSVSRRFSIISKQRHVSAITSMIYKNRLEYREKNHSKRLKGFEQSRHILSKMNAEDDNDDDDYDFHMLDEHMKCLQQKEIFPLDFVPSERFEMLAKYTESEHPYSNEATAIETIEANESSSLSSSFCQSKTMSNIIIYGKIPKIQVNETPQRELVRLKHRSRSICVKLFDLTKQFFVVFIFIMVYVSYVLSNFLIRKNV